MNSTKLKYAKVQTYKQEEKFCVTNRTQEILTENMGKTLEPQALHFAKKSRSAGLPIPKS